MSKFDKAMAIIMMAALAVGSVLAMIKAFQYSAQTNGVAALEALASGIICIVILGLYAKDYSDEKRKWGKTMFGNKSAFTKEAEREFKKMLSGEKRIQDNLSEINEHMNQDFKIVLERTETDGPCAVLANGDTGAMMVALLSQINELQGKMDLDDYGMIALKNSIATTSERY